MYRIAFVGNPNVGKSAWINVLSNSDLKVGNWQGVTVEKKEAFVKWGKETYHLIDLPGIYSLEENDNEEDVTIQYLKKNAFDLIVNVVDATNLAGNLMLTLLLRDLQIPMFMICNFFDEVKKMRMEIDIQSLSRRLSIPIIACSALEDDAYRKVSEAIQNQVKNDYGGYHPLFTEKLDEIFVTIYDYVQKHSNQCSSFLIPFVIQIMKDDEFAYKQLSVWHIDIDYIHELCCNITSEEILNDYWYIVNSLMQYVHSNGSHRNRNSEKIDRILLHKWLGLPILCSLFFIVLYLVFQLSSPWNDFIAYVIQVELSGFIEMYITWMPLFLQQLILQGILQGIGGILGFIPLMMLLFLVISFLEESGYMVRIAFLLDKAMQNFHLNGKSLFPLLMGFGCNVPAIYATRILEQKQERWLCALLIPFMSCSARLPVYALFASAFFPDEAAFMVITLYGIGIMFAMVMAVFLSRFPVFRNERVMVIELIPYRLPSIHIIWKKVKMEVKGYAKKAFGIVLWTMIILWSISYFPNGEAESSYLYTGAKIIQPMFIPLGFGDRIECIASLPGGIIAKETIVGFFDSLSSNDEGIKEQDNITTRIKRIMVQGKHALYKSFLFFLPQIDTENIDSNSVISDLWKGKDASLKAFSFLIYVLLSIPCIMTLQAMYHEYGYRFVLLSIIIMLTIPYLASFLVFQIMSYFL